MIFQTGSNQWERFDYWPPATTERKLYLHPQGRLSFVPPRGGSETSVSFSQPEPVTPGEVTEYRINLRDRSHRFRAGHRIMVQV